MLPFGSRKVYGTRMRHVYHSVCGWSHSSTSIIRRGSDEILVVGAGSPARAAAVTAAAIVARPDPHSGRGSRLQRT